MLHPFSHEQPNDEDYQEKSANSAPNGGTAVVVPPSAAKQDQYKENKQYQIHGKPTFRKFADYPSANLSSARLWPNFGLWIVGRSDWTSI